MARKTRKQTIGHAQVQSDIKSGGKVIAARPSHFNTTPPPVDRQHLENLQNTARGIGSVAVEVERQRQIFAKKQAEKEALLGAADAKLAGERSMEQYEEYRKSAKTGARIQGYMSETGRMAAHEAQREHDQFVRENPMLTEDQFNESIAGVVSAKLKGMNDKHFVKSFLEGMGNYEANARAAWVQDSYMESQREIASTYNGVLRDDLAALPEGTAAADVTERLNTFESVMRQQNFHPDEIFEMKLQAAEEHAIRTGDRTIFGTDDLGIWEGDVKGADGKTRPGSANSPKRNKALRDAQGRVNRALSAGAAKKDKHRELAYRRGFRRDLAEGNLEQAAARKDAEWEAGNLTAAQMDEAERKIEERHKEIQREFQLNLAIDDAAPMPDGVKESEIQGAIDNSAKQVGVVAQQNPDDYLEAVELHREREVNTGLMDSNFVRKAKSLKPSENGDIAAYHRTAFQVAARYEESPELVRKNLGEAATNDMLLYVDQIEAGADNITAYGFMIEASSETGRELRRGFTQDASWKDEVEEHLDDVADDNLDNYFYAKEQMRTRIRTNYITNGGNMDLAVKHAKQQMDSQFMPVTLPGTDDGDGNEIELLVETGGLKLPNADDMSSAMMALTQDPALRKKFNVPDDAVLYWAPNPNDRNGPWRIYDARNHSPIVYSTGGKVQYASVDMRKTVSEYKSSQAAERRAKQTKEDVADAARKKESRARQKAIADRAGEARQKAEADRIPFGELFN
jgi:hypothetical protein